MSSDFEKAAELLKKGNYTLTAVSGDRIITSSERGVKPLLELIDGGKSLCGFCAADKVVGRAAAFLYVMLKPVKIYAGVISRPAFEVLKQYGIDVDYDVMTDAVRSRDNTGFCPMETAVWDAGSPCEALALIREKLMRLRAVNDQSLLS